MKAILSSFSELSRQAERQSKTKSVAFLPVGCIEQHGPVLPLGTDSIIAEGIAETLVAIFEEDGINAVLYPTIHYSPSRTNLDYYCSTSVDENSFRDYVSSTSNSILSHNFEVLVFVCMHGPAEPSLTEIALKYNNESFKSFACKKKLIVIIGTSSLNAVFQKHFKDEHAKHADYREFLLLFKILGEVFFDQEKMEKISKFDKEYREKEGMHTTSILGTPVNKRSFKGVIGYPLFLKEVSHSVTAELIWNDLISQFVSNISSVFKEQNSI